MTLPAVRLRSGLRILHADNHVLVVDKPAGLWATGPRDSVLTIVADHLLAAHGTRFAAAAHRLDRPVSGAMLVARTRKAAGRIAAAFRARAHVSTSCASMYASSKRAPSALRAC